jgi:hypothetical protein
VAHLREAASIVTDVEDGVERNLSRISVLDACLITTKRARAHGRVASSAIILLHVSLETAPRGTACFKFTDAATLAR